MKKTILTCLTAIALIATPSCTTTSGNTSIGDVLGNVLGSLGSSNTASGLLNMVIGHFKIDKSELIGTWSYTAPGCAFTSENLLAKAGGNVAAENVKSKLAPAYQSVGISASNTRFVFNEDNTFNARIDGLPLSGTYTYDADSGCIKMKMAIMSMTAYITRTSSGLALTYESKKLLNVLQTVSALSSNSTIKAVGDLSKQFDGVRVGFELAK